MQLATLRRLLRISGALLLPSYLLFHAWEHWPIHDGRDAVLARLARTSNVGLEVVLVIAPFALHAGLGWFSARANGGARGYASPLFRRLQWGSGALALAFLIFHLAGVWLPKFGALLPLHASYNAVREQAGTWFGVCLYVLGIGAVCVHVGQGIGAALVEAGPTAIDARASRALGVLVGVALYVVFVSVLAVYATGAALL